jgi:exonuclease V gamma subunit
MFKAGIDQDAIVQMFSQASAARAEDLRKAVSEATLKALQGRELTLANIRKVIETVTQAASTGAAQGKLPAANLGDVLSSAFAGMDAALLQAVQAHRKALQQFIDQGVALQDKHMKDALANIEKMEDVFFATVGKAAEQATGALRPAWEQVLSAMKLKGTDTGTQAHSSVEQLMTQAQTALRAGRAASMRGAQAMMESYATLVSGVLIGMTEGLQSGAKPPER